MPESYELCALSVLRLEGNLGRSEFVRSAPDESQLSLALSQ